MAKRQHLSGHQQSIVKNYYANLDTLMLQKLGEIVSDLYVNADDDAKTARLWTSARKALEKLGAEPGRVSSILTKRNVEDLALLLGDLNLAAKTPPGGKAAAAPAPTPPETPPAAPAETPQPTTADADAPPDRQTLKRAMKAFRKRLKLTKLDEESGLGYGPLTGGKHSTVVAIQPPNQYPPEVWAELVRQGRLKDTGQGFFELVEQ